LIFHRCFPWDGRSSEPDGPLWFPRPYQGDGRHDNPSVYGCLYGSESDVAGVVEQLAQFRGLRLSPQMLSRAGLRLALASIELDDGAEVIDLDEPRVLAEEGLRPSLVATRERSITQPQALELYRRHAAAAALRWWSVHESLWANVTVFDRAAPMLRLVEVRALELDDDAVVEAAETLDLL
jgi:RES domain